MNIAIPKSAGLTSDWLTQLASAVSKSGIRLPGFVATTSLIARPIRQSLESRAGHLMRVAEENSIPGLEALGSRLGAVPSELLMLTDEALEQVFRGVPICELASSAVRVDPATELVRRRLWSRSRICPECARSGFPTPLEFDMPLTVRCDRHELRLIDTCPQCEMPLTYFRRRLDRCNCGQQLSQIKGEPLGLSADLFKIVFSPWRTSGSWALQPCGHVPEEIRSALAIRYLIQELESGTGNAKRASPWLQTTDWLVIEKLLAGFPALLAETLSDICDDLGEKSRTELLARLDMAALPHILPLTAGVRQDRTRSRSYLSVPTASGDASLVSKAKIRQLAKVDAAAAAVLIENELAMPDLLELPAVGDRIWVAKTTADALSHWYRQTAAPVESGSILGCPPSFVVGLFKANLLPGECLSAKPRSPRFQRRVLDKHLLHVVSLRQPNLDGVEIAAVCSLAPAPPSKKHWRPRWQKLMKQLISREIPAFQIEDGVGWSSLGVRCTDLVSVLGPNWRQTYVSG